MTVPRATVPRTTLPGATLPGATTEPRDLDDAVSRLSVALGRLNRQLRRAAASGLGPGSVSALATIRSAGPLRLGDLAAREGVSPPTLTRIVAVLEENGLLSRTPDPADRRASMVGLTPAGEQMVTGLGSTWSAQLLARVEGLSPGDQDLLVRAVRVIEDLAADEG